MSINDPYILMWLEGPLQSWGADSRYGRRNTLPFPTRSGVMGIVCAALGAGGAQTTLLAEFASTDMQVLALSRRALDGSMQTPPGLLQDFQMVGSGYDEQDPWQNLLVPKTAEGKKPVGGGAKMTFRYYVQEMAFAVLLQVPSSWVVPVADALVAPVWDLSLGRKNCVPTEFIYQGTYATVVEATCRVEQLATEKGRVCTLIVRQGACDGGEVLTLNDVPLQFGTIKRYRDRQVTVIEPGSFFE